MNKKAIPKTTNDQKEKAAPSKRPYTKKKKKPAKKIAKKQTAKDPEIEVVKKGSSLTIYIFK